MNQDKFNPYSSPSSVVETTPEIIDIVAYRKKLVPLWIKIFGWLFIVLGIMVPITAIYSIILGIPVHFMLFGLTANGSLHSPMVIFFIVLFIALAVSAYGLLFGRSWGLILCLILGYMSLAICLVTTVIGFVSSKGFISIRLEIIVLIPYLIRLHKIKNKWHATAPA